MESDKLEFSPLKSVFNVHDATQGGHTKKAPRVNDYL